MLAIDYTITIVNEPGIPVVSLGVATGTGEAWGSTGFSVPFGSASVTALGVVKWVPMSRLARTHL